MNQEIIYAFLIRVIRIKNNFYKCWDYNDKIIKTERKDL